MRGVLFSQCDACFIWRWMVQLFGSLAFGHRQRNHFNYPESRCRVQRILDAFQQNAFWSQKDPYSFALSQLIVDFLSEHETIWWIRTSDSVVFGVCVNVFLGSFLFTCARTFERESFWQGATIAGLPAIDGPGAGVNHEMSEWSCYIPWFILFLAVLIESGYLFAHIFDIFFSNGKDGHSVFFIWGKDAIHHLVSNW